jgi:dienelactone hydrolase
MSPICGTEGSTFVRIKEIMNKQHCSLGTLLCIFVVPLLSIFAGANQARATDMRYGPFGPEGMRMREQLWIVPSVAKDLPLRATVFRPEDKWIRDAGGTDVARPLVVINHGSDDTTRIAVAMPVYYWLSRWFVDRGYIVVIPQRRGYGATGGDLQDSIGTCDNPDHYASGLAAADDIASTIEFMSKQPFVDHDNTLVVGISSGGWASLALAARNPKSVKAIVNFAGGRGGHAHGHNQEICAPERLEHAAHDYASTARIPTIWFYANNDSYFSPDIAQMLAQAWSDGGGLVEAHILKSFGWDGHNLADDRAGWDLWGDSLDNFILRHSATPAVVTSDNLPNAIIDKSTVSVSASGDFK